MTSRLMGRQGQRASSLDPRTKMLLVLIISTVLIGGTDSGIMQIVKPFLAGIPMVLLLAIGKRGTAASYCILYTLAYIGQLYIIPYTNGLLNFVVVAICAIFFRFMPGVMMGAYLVNSTRVGEFTAAMEKMHISSQIIIPLSVMFRFFPTVREEYNAIGDAMRMRGVRFGGGKPGKLLEYRLVPLMMSCVKIGEELSVAALTRGLGAPSKRTHISEIGFKVQDKIMIGIICMVGVLFVLVKCHIL